MPAPTRSLLNRLASRFGGRPPWIRFALAPGATANTAITISGIQRHHTLLSVLELQPPTAAAGNAIVADRAGVTTITTNNTIQISVSTAGNQLLVIWLDVG